MALHQTLAPIVGHLAIEGEGRGVTQQRCAILGLKSHEYAAMLQGPSAKPDDSTRLNIGDLARRRAAAFSPRP